MDETDQPVPDKVAYETAQRTAKYIDFSHRNSVEHTSILSRIQDSTISWGDEDLHGTACTHLSGHTPTISIIYGSASDRGPYEDIEWAIVSRRASRSIGSWGREETLSRLASWPRQRERR